MEKKCTACGGEIYYDGEDDVSLGDEFNFVDIIGQAWCNECDKRYKYRIAYRISNNPYSIELIEVEG